MDIKYRFFRFKHSICCHNFNCILIPLSSKYMRKSTIDPLIEQKCVHQSQMTLLKWNRLFAKNYFAQYQ